MRPQAGKQKLFDAAMKLFESQGYFATTVEQITVEAGVSKGLVYNYFKSKEELLVALIDTTTERMKSVAQTLDHNATLELSLEQFLNNFFAYLKTEKKFLKLQLTLMLMPELSETVNAPQKERAKVLLSMLESWFKRAEVTQPKNQARVFLALLDGVALHYLSTYDNYPLNTMKPHIIQAAKDLCRQTNSEGVSS